MKPAGTPPDKTDKGGKINLWKAEQGPIYDNNRYPADNAFKAGGNEFTHTAKGVGSWWHAQFKGGNSWVWSVRILSRKDCCGARLGGARVLVGATLCGKVESNTKNGQWYEVQCKEPLQGGRVRIEST